MVVIDGVYYDNPLAKELDFAYQSCLQDDDAVIVIDGKEGSGKSKFARQIGYYFSKKSGLPFGLDNIHFDVAPYREAIERNAGKVGYVGILDESRSSLNNKRSMSKGNVGFTNWFSECRDANAIHILILPAVHDLDAYISLWRLKVVLHLTKKKIFDEQSQTWMLKRGDYYIIPPDNMQTYIHNRNKYGRYAYPILKGNNAAIRRFNDTEVLPDVEAYKAKKKEWREKKGKEEERESDRVNIIRALCWYGCQMGGNAKDIATLVNKHPNSIYKYIREYKQEAITD